MTKCLIGFSALLSLAVFLISCDYTELKNPPATASTLDASTIDFATVSSQVFQPHCITCHGGGSATGVFLDSYAHVTSFLARIQGEIAGGTMPPKSPLSAADSALVLAWISAGAPQFVSTSGPASPTPTPVPLPPLGPTYSSLNANVFAPKCVICHSAAGKANKIPLDTYSAIVNGSSAKFGPLINTANPAQSLIYLRVSTGDMPPAKQGSAPLSADETAAILQWITNDLPQ